MCAHRQDVVDFGRSLNQPELQALPAEWLFCLDQDPKPTPRSIIRTVVIAPALAVRCLGMCFTPTAIHCGVRAGPLAAISRRQHRHYRFPPLFLVPRFLVGLHVTLGILGAFLTHAHILGTMGTVGTDMKRRNLFVPSRTLRPGTMWEQMAFFTASPSGTAIRVVCLPGPGSVPTRRRGGIGRRGFGRFASITRA